MQFADKIQKLRKMKGMSQENLAEAVGVSRQAVSKWESGQTFPEMDKMIALSELFQVSLDHLLKDGPEPERTEGPVYAAAAAPVLMRAPYHYEYKSERTWRGLPLVHINIGSGLYVAKGIVAIGNIAVGGIAIGVLALGGLCLGALALGLIGLAGLAVGLLFAAGGLAAGAVAIGGAAFGIAAVGGVSLGMYSLGGCAIASRIAIGGYANGHIAIGETVKGAFVIQSDNLGSISSEQVRSLIQQEYPHLWKPFVDLLVSIFS